MSNYQRVLLAGIYLTRYDISHDWFRWQILQVFPSGKTRLGVKTSQVWGELRERHRTWRYQWSERKLLDHEWLGLELDNSCEIVLDNA
jgi:hypothetical protein